MIIQLLAIYGLMLLVRDADGPWGVIARWRNWMLSLPYSLGPQFYNLLNCSICLGCWAGTTVYLLMTPCQFWMLAGGRLWALTGASVGLILDAVIDRLRRE